MSIFQIILLLVLLLQSTQYFLYQVLAYRPLKYRSSDDIYAIIDDNGGTYPYNPIKTIENTYSTIRNRQLSFNSYLNYNILKDFPDKTLIVITHKTENLAGMDRIYEIQNHAIKECDYAELEKSAFVHQKKKG